MTMTAIDERLAGLALGTETGAGLRISVLAEYLPCAWCGARGGEACRKRTDGSALRDGVMHEIRRRPLWEVWQEGMLYARTRAQAEAEAGLEIGSGGSGVVVEAEGDEE